MRAAFYTQLGAAADVLQIGDVKTPEPGPGEIQLKISASGVNPSDYKTRTNGRGGNMGFPRIIPHSDGAGVISAVGDGVDAGLVGRSAWVMNAQYMRPSGTAAEYVSLPQKYVIPLPDSLSDRVSFNDAACFGIPFLTARLAIDLAGDIAGMNVLVTGGAGAVGHQAVQIARRRGARVIATVSSPEKAGYVKDAGADEALNYRDDDYVAQLKSLTDGRGVDRIIEVDVAANGPQYSAILAPEAKVLIYGTGQPTATLGGVFIPLRPTLQWLLVYELTDAQRAAGVGELNAMLAEGSLKTTIAESFPLDDIVAAHEMVERATHLGNVVLEVG
jgi:NADPH:quinone reductase